MGQQTIKIEVIITRDKHHCEPSLRRRIEWPGCVANYYDVGVCVWKLDGLTKKLFYWYQQNWQTGFWNSIFVEFPVCFPPQPIPRLVIYATKPGQNQLQRLAQFSQTNFDSKIVFFLALTKSSDLRGLFKV
jgi:hypothetical protein